MLFLVNPGTGRRDRKVKGKRKARRVTRRRKRPAKTGAKTGGIMARRRRSRAKARASAPRRRRSVRRRRRSVVVRANPPIRRRRRRSVARHGAIRRVSRRRHGYRRNPGGAGIVGTIKQGVTDGATVLAGEIVQNKAVALVDKFVPAMTGAGAIVRTAGLNLAVAVAGSLGARKALPSHARMLSAGLFARALANIVATTPAAALLGDGVVYEGYDEGYGAYPSALGDGRGDGRGTGYGAYPNPATADLPHAEH